MQWLNYLIFCFFLCVSLSEGYISKCIKPGVKCADCENLNHCTKTPSGMVTHRLNFCNNSLGEHCSVKDGGCSPDPTVCKIFGLKQIACQNASMFPDPYDCTTYHHCIELAETKSFMSIKYTCPDDRAYDSLTATCRLKHGHRVCRESPVPSCQVPLQTGALKENPSIYFVCVRRENDLIPLMYKCRNGEEYKPAKHACEETSDASKLSFYCFEEGTFIDPTDSHPLGYPDAARIF